MKIKNIIEKRKKLIQDLYSDFYELYRLNINKIIITNAYVELINKYKLNVNDIKSSEKLIKNIENKILEEKDRIGIFKLQNLLVDIDKKNKEKELENNKLVNLIKDERNKIIYNLSDYILEEIKIKYKENINELKEQDPIFLHKCKLFNEDKIREINNEEKEIHQFVEYSNNLLNEFESCLGTEYVDAISRDANFSNLSTLKNSRVLTNFNNLIKNINENIKNNELINYMKNKKLYTDRSDFYWNANTAGSSFRAIRMLKAAKKELIELNKILIDIKNKIQITKSSLLKQKEISNRNALTTEQLIVKTIKELLEESNYSIINKINNDIN